MPQATGQPALLGPLDPDQAPPRTYAGLEGGDVGAGVAPPADEALSELDPLVLTLAVTPQHAAAGSDPNGAGATSRGVSTATAIEVGVVEQVVRRVLWGGDRRRGVARIELDGDLAGTTLWVRGEGSELSLEVDLGPSSASRELPERLVERLRSRGIDFSSVEIR